MLITDQLKNIKTDLQTIQNIKNNLTNDIKQNFNDLQTQTTKNITAQLNEKSAESLRNLTTQITNELNTKKTELTNNINSSLSSVERNLRNNLNTFASTELQKTLAQAKEQAIARIDTEQIAQDIANDSELKSYIANKIQQNITQNIKELDFSPEVEQKVLENLQNIKVDEQKIADLQLENITTLLREEITQAIQNALESELKAQNFDTQIKELIEKNAQDFVQNHILQVHNYNTSILHSALAQRHIYTLLCDMEQKLLNDEYLKEMQKLTTTTKQNIFLSK